MDRQIVYVGAIPQDLDLLNTNKNTMVALGYLMQALLGTSTYVDGLACTPTGPATLTVNVAGGSIYALEEIDATGYGSIPADTTDQIVKQGIIIPTTNFSTPAPVTSGQSVVYLVQAAYQDTDGGSTVLPYYNSSNPAVPYSGPGNNGQPQNTVRQGQCHLALKTGVAATTGTQVTPTADAGYVGLWAITVANGQSTVTSGNIAQLSTAPFISPKLTAVIAAIQAGSANFAHDTSGAANTITIALNPAVASLTDGMRVYVKVANTNAGATVMNTNGLGNVSVVTPAGSALSASTMTANGVYEFIYDGNGTRWIFAGTGSLGAAAYLGVGTGLGSSGGNLINTGVVTVKEQVFTSTGTYTPSTGMIYCDVYALGAGGGGGGIGSSGTGGAGGGNAGCPSQGTFSAATIGASQAITIGAAGAAGASTGANGGTGGTTSLGALMTGTGGTGGTGVNTNPSGGGPLAQSSAGTGGNVNGIGGVGSYGFAVSSGNFGGPGANSPWGAGGAPPAGNNPGNAGLGYGSGGSGATATATSNAHAGGAGAPGIVIIKEYCSQ